MEVRASRTQVAANQHGCCDHQHGDCTGGRAQRWTVASRSLATDERTSDGACAVHQPSDGGNPEPRSRGSGTGADGGEG